MEEGNIMIKCDLCYRSFQFGPHRYDGEYLSQYKMAVCDWCLRGHCDGVGPSHEDQFKKHLDANNIPLPERNAKGWFPLK